MSDEKREPEYKPRLTGIANDIDTRRTVELGFETVNPGTVYRTLRKMEKDGLCESEWETTASSGGPARRMYSITDAGGAYLELWARSMEQYQQTMDDFFRAYKSGMSRS